MANSTYNDVVQWYDNITQNTEINFKSSGFNNTIYTAEGYVNFETISDTAFGKIDPSDMVDITNVDLTATVTQPNPRKPFKCNFSFNFSFSLNLKLPNINPNSPNLSLLYKIDEFSKEVAKINDILIDAIRAMNCCDIENAYNHTIVPFFRWFADHPDIKNCSPEQDPTSGNCGPMFGSDTLPYLMLKIAEALIKIYVVLRPLACLLRPLPGNPWWPADFDPAKLVYGFLDFFDMYVDYVISGKLVDEYLLQPTRKFRQNIQNCITGNNDYQNTIKDNILRNTITMINIQKEIDLINNKLLNLETAKNNYLNKYENIFASYEIIIESLNQDDITTETVYPFQTIFNYFINSYKTTHLNKNFEEKNPVLQNLKIFLENFDDESTIIYFINKYFPSLNAKVSLVETNSIPENTIYSSQIDYNVDASNLSDIENFWISFFKSWIPIIQDAYKYYTLYLQQQNQIKILEKTKDTLNNYIENLQRQETKDVPGVTSEDNIKARYRNLVAKDGNPGNICNCIIYTLFDNPKEPALYKLTTFFKADMNKFLNKEAISWKIGDYSLLGQYMYPNNNWKEDISKKSLYFSEKFIDELNIENKNALNEIKNIIRTSIQFNTKDYTSLIKTLQAFESNPNLIPYSELTNTFLNYLDDKIKNDYYLKPNYTNWLKKVDLYNPYNENITSTFEMLNFDVNWIPTSMLPSEFYKKYLMPLYALLSVSQELFKTTDTLFYNKVLGPDEKNFINAKEQARALLNSIEILIQTTNDTELKVKLNLYLDKSQKLYEAFFSKYYPIDVLKDPNEIEVRSYQNVYSSFQDTIETYFGTSIEKLINDYIDKRADIFTNNIELIYRKIYLYKFVSNLADFINGKDLFSNLASIWVWEPLDIPCSCDIFCKIIQYIINLLLQGLNKILNSILNAIINWLLNTWIGKLIKIILLKLKCIMMFLKMSDDLDKVSDVTDSLVNSLKQRIKLYVDPSICLLNLNENDTTSYANLDENISKLINDTMNDVINQETNGGQNPGDLLPDPNFNLSQPQINFNTDTNETEINLGVSNSNIAQPAFYSQITSGLPAKLVLSDGINVGTVDPNTNFPLLNFNCNCTIDTCNECLTDEKINNTLNFLNS